MKKIVFILIVFALLFGCSKNDEPVIQKVADNDVKPVEEPEIIEEVDDNLKKDEFIEFNVDDEIIRLKFDLVPILYEYLRASENRMKMVEEMHMEKIEVNEESIYLLEFACHHNRCSYLLINKNVKDDPSLLIADLTKFENLYISPDQQQIILKFSRLTDQGIPFHHLILIDLNKWKHIPMNNNPHLNYHWPIQTVQWIDDETIAITLPDIDIINSKEEQLLEWLESPTKNTVDVEIPLDELYE